VPQFEARRDTSLLHGRKLRRKRPFNLLREIENLSVPEARTNNLVTCHG
jgi:hypothetical protein